MIAENAVDDPTEYFWQRIKKHEIVMQACQACAYVRWPVAPLCPECGSTDSEWKIIEGMGTVWSTTTYHRAFSAEFKELVPYTILLIVLDAGPELVGRLAPESSSVEIDGRVRATFYDGPAGAELLWSAY